MKKKIKKVETLKIAPMMKFIDRLVYFNPEDPALVMNYHPSSLSDKSRRPEARLIIITGENATGKSFVSRLVMNYCRGYVSTRVEIFPITMSTRTSEGMIRAFMFQGPESEESTGVNSAYVLQGAFKNANDRKHHTALFLDEPAIGLSESYCAAMGSFIAEQIKEMSSKVKLVVLVSHSRVLIGTLLSQLFKKGNPHHIRFGDDLTLSQWLRGEAPVKDIGDLLELPNKSRDIWRNINKLIRD